MIKGKRYTKFGVVTEIVDVDVTRIGDYIYLTVTGKEDVRVEISVEDWDRLPIPPIGFGAIR